MLCLPVFSSKHPITKQLLVSSFSRRWHDSHTLKLLHDVINQLARLNVIRITYNLIRNCNSYNLDNLSRLTNSGLHHSCPSDALKQSYSSHFLVFISLKQNPDYPKLCTPVEYYAGCCSRCLIIDSEARACVEDKIWRKKGFTVRSTVRSLTSPPGWVLPYMTYTGMCRWTRCGFCPFCPKQGIQFRPRLSYEG